MNSPLILWHLGVSHRLHFVVPVQQGDIFGWICLDQELTPWESGETYLSPDSSVKAGVEALDKFLQENRTGVAGWPDPSSRFVL